MTVLSHVMVGAVVGAYTTSVPFAIIGGVASHFVLDSIPHHDVQLGRDVARSLPGKVWLSFTILGFVALGLFWNTTPTVFLAAAAAVLVDVENLVYLLTGVGIPIHRAGFFHRKAPFLGGFVTETLIVVFCTVLLYLGVYLPHA